MKAGNDAHCYSAKAFMHREVATLEKPTSL
jgi:hypothetical protein